MAKTTKFYGTGRRKRMVSGFATVRERRQR